MNSIGPFEDLIGAILKEEISNTVNGLFSGEKSLKTTYLTIKEVSELNGISTSTVRDLTYRRAMPHLLMKSRIIFNQEEIKPFIDGYKQFGWTDPNGEWEVSKILKENPDFNLFSIHTPKEEPILIDEAIRKIINEELNQFAEELKGMVKKNGANYGRTNLTVQEAAKYFRTSNATILSLIHDEGMPHLRLGSRYIIPLEEAEAFLWRTTAENYAHSGNIYWKRILKRIDEEEEKRRIAFERALSKLNDEL